MKNKIMYFIFNIESFICLIMFITMFIMVFIQIVSRSLFNYPLYYTEEITRFSYLWIVFFSMSLCEKIQKHFLVSIIYDILGELQKKILDIFVDIIVISVFLYLLYWSYNFFHFSKVIISAALEISTGFVSICMVIGFFLCTIRRIFIMKDNIIDIIRIIFIHDSKENLIK